MTSIEALNQLLDSMDIEDSHLRLRIGNAIKLVGELIALEREEAILKSAIARYGKTNAS